MSPKGPHEKIIHQLCREILIPHGVFQRGTSRVYIDDNGFFFTVIEFQPSAGAKGTYLNIALHFLWNERDFLSYDFPFDSSRVKTFIEYQNDEQFSEAVRLYVETALEYVMCYRKLCDAKMARKYLRKWRFKYRRNVRVKELDIINVLDNEEIQEKISRSRAFWHSQPAMKKMKQDTVYDR